MSLIVTITVEVDNVSAGADAIVTACRNVLARIEAMDGTTPAASPYAREPRPIRGEG